MSIILSPMPRQYFSIETLSDLVSSDLAQTEFPTKILLDPKDEANASKLLQRQLEASDYYIIGVDEAGRGPVAGPVTAGACLLPPSAITHSQTSPQAQSQAQIQGPNPALESLLDRLDDSKKLTEAHRAELYPQVQQLSLAYGIAEASALEIDEHNILNATFIAMRRAIESTLNMMSERGLPSKPILFMVDGNQFIRELDRVQKKPEGGTQFWELYQQPVIQGDGWISCISAASILAKHHRDMEMERLSEEYPQYDLAQNKGYPSPKHIEAIKEVGRSKIHRQSFHIKAIDELDLFG